METQVERNSDDFDHYNRLQVLLQAICSAKRSQKKFHYEIWRNHIWMRKQEQMKKKLMSFIGSKVLHAQQLITTMQ